MAALTLLLACFLSTPAQAARSPLSYLRAHNFRLSQAGSVRDWLLFAPEESRGSAGAEFFFSRESQVGALYDDIKSKDSARLFDRIERSYGAVFDVAAKGALEARFGAFRQRFSVDAAVSLTANDPVFPEVSGILFNDYAFRSDYSFRYRGWILRPSLTYGLRRALDRNFTVGQLLDTKPDVKLKAQPYRFFAEAGLDIARAFAAGEVRLRAESLPLYQEQYDYWQVELGYRSPNLLAGRQLSWMKEVRLWTALSPLYGGDYSFVRTIRAGVSVKWLPYVQTDVGFMDKFLPGGVLRLGPEALHLELLTFARAEDDAHIFTARQYGLSLAGSF